MILKFPDRGARQHFTDLVTRERPWLRSALEESYALPYLLVDRISQEDAQWIKGHIGTLGRAFEDRRVDLF